MGEHVGHPYHLAAGETAAYVLEVTSVEMFELFQGSVLVSGPVVRLRLRNPELTGSGESAYLTLAEVDRLRRLLELCAADMTEPAVVADRMDHDHLGAKERRRNGQ